MKLNRATFVFDDGTAISWEPIIVKGRKWWNVSARFDNWEMSWDGRALSPNQTNAGYYRRKLLEGIEETKKERGSNVAGV